MRVLNTRHEAAARKLETILQRENISSVRDPLLKIDFKLRPISTRGIQALIVTSASGSIALTNGVNSKRIPVFAVGDATAEVLRNSGFKNIKIAGGNVSALVDLILSTLKPKNGPLIYLSGKNIAVDLVTILAAKEFTVQREVVYNAITANNLSGSTKKLLREKEIDAVLFFSPRTAETFANLIKKAGLKDITGSLSAVCLSETVAAPIRDLGWREIVVAKTADQEALVNSVCHLRNRDNNGCYGQK